MVLIPAGPFFMGRAPDDIFAPDDERPGRTVRLSPYLIDVGPVTNERYARFVEAGGYRQPKLWSPAGWTWRAHGGPERPLSFVTRGFDAPEQPVAGVSWFEADAYARWAEKLLPTEAQWEKGARGEDGRRFPWGEDLPRPELCNFGGNVGATTAPGAFPAGNSPYGLVDMAGNVNNWCRDWYWAGFYGYCGQEGIEEDPECDGEVRDKAPVGLNARSDRGGGFMTPFAMWEALSASGRLKWAPETRQMWNGFRCVVEL